MDQQRVLQGKLKGWFPAYAACEMQLQRQDVLFTAFFTGLQGWLEEQRKLLKHQERHALAVLLAAELDLGESCPVCGSTEHPALQKNKETIMNTGETSTSEGLLHSVELLVQQVKERQFQGLQVVRGMAGLYKQAAELAFPDVVINKQQEDNAVVRLALQEAAAGQEAGAHVEMSSFHANMGLEDWQKEWHILESAFQTGVSQVEECERVFQDLHKEHGQLAQQDLVLSAQAHAAASLLVEAESRLSGLTEAIKDQVRQWHEHFVEFSWDDIDDQLHQLLENERLADELRGRIEKSIPFLEELLVNIESLQLAAQEQRSYSLAAS